MILAGSNCLNIITVDGFSKRLSEMVAVVYPGQSFWKESEQVRFFNI